MGMTAYSGVKFGASIDISTSGRDDWLISPKVTLGTNSSLSMYVQTFHPSYDLERYRVGVSTTTIVPTNFTIISDSPYQEASLSWEKVTFDLSAYDNQKVYIGIQCITESGFIFMIDDIGVTSTTGINTKKIDKINISLYPNPTNGILNINSNIPENIDFEVTVYDVFGKMVKCAKNPEFIDLSEQANGIYYVNIQDNNNTVTKKISLIK
jgi:hypothetical protein